MRPVTVSHAARRPALLAACLTLTAGLAVTACSSGSTGTSAPSSTSSGSAASAASGSPFGTPPDISTLAYAALVECAIHRGLIANSVLNSQHNFAKWYHNGQVIMNTQLGEWWVQDQETVVKGKTLAEWEQGIGSSQQLPTAVCGSTAMPSPAPTS